MKVAVIDGQGGSIGKAIVEQLRAASSDLEIIAIGTNSLATSAMIRAGATAGATGENPVKVACRDVDWIIGPIGIIMADAMLGEITLEIASAIGGSKAHKVFIPINRCVTVAGVQPKSLASYIADAVKIVLGR
ncbi:MAG: DUF3842 family protein [Spirochaetales bacterium]|jgi:microcystin-dependent protein|nr:DUF3842 family protein [Spirochaetales bacterium]